MTASKIFLYFCLFFIGGIFINSFFAPHLLYLGGGLILGVLLISVFWRYPAGKPSASRGAGKKMVVIGFCLLFLVAGIWRHERAELRIKNNELRKINDLNEEITLISLVAGEPDIREKSVKLTVQPENINGRVLVTANRYPEYQYGDKLKIIGKLKTPQIFDEREEDKSSSSLFAIAREFNYKDYLAKDGIYSVIYYPEIELIQKNIGDTYVIYGKVFEIKNKLRGVIEQNLSPPQSSILAAIILGDKRQISQEWKDKLNYAGIRHLTAISGMHVAVLTVILMSFLIGLGFWRQQAFYFSIILIFLFIVMTGLQSSAIRAGIMGGLFLFAQLLGRMNISSRAIVFAATLMLVHNPLLLKLDVGFQLSFLAIMGIIYLAPVFQELLHKTPDFLQLKNIFIMTISAQVFTLPLLIYNFGYFSAVAPFTNILVVPLLPFIMGLGFIFALLGAVWSYFGWFFSLPVWLLLTYLIKIVDWFSGFSFSAFVFEISWFWLATFYLVLVLIIWRLNEKQKLKFLNY